MRYLGNKTKLLHFIESVIEKYNIQGETFADLLAGTGTVGDFFKGKYQIISNDYMYFSKILNKAKLLNNTTPGFKGFIKKYNRTPFEWLNTQRYEPQDNYFIYQNYTPVGARMYLTEANAVKIDGMRLDIEEFYKSEIIDEKEYAFLLASLIESLPKVSNTSGTYQAFFKFWEARALKEFVLEPLEMNESLSVDKHNIVYSENTNKLVRDISGDIAYIDPPYTITQYTNSYHLLETVARYDYPEIFGKTGRRVKRELSGYSNKQKALYEFEDLFRQINFDHVLVSYSNQSIVPIEELIDLAKLFAIDNEVFVETNEYREYTTNNSSYKGNGKKLEEVIIYFKKNHEIKKSPLNYSGSKDVLLPIIFKQLPKHVGTFVDAMGGAFNVGANVFATNKVIYNEYNSYVYQIIEMIVTKDKNELINDVTEVVNRFGLKKKAKDEYIALRDHFNNEDSSPLNLFTLQIYAFQNMIRFNSSQKMNTPVGNNEFNGGTKERIEEFKINSCKFEFRHGKYEDLVIDDFPKDSVFYFDPPYFVTNAAYNDGKRGLDGWDADKESALLNFLLSIHQKGYKFMLSNVLQHREKKHHLLIEWIHNHEFNVVEIGKTGIKYPRTEVLITNYNIFE
ncbi:adenine-specific DNA-methyltransferase [Virgibacillus natechei]|uniref:site-specific DNA-methyltransferase (adenine-specific) n=1 Tax=Virgibacillus natechei TaxID=1216297 RepID=A0ABS4IK54_9BACI|nr:DNA adenine methylase [Virgibacillus natechei]MBP1971343.1 adenine-specific DNA-methyltransferase [Virgibacillus natechei]UZD12922.1 DNA adenine methylase [Virgibacillus natechei]